VAIDPFRTAFDNQARLHAAEVMEWQGRLVDSMIAGMGIPASHVAVVQALPPASPVQSRPSWLDAPASADQDLWQRIMNRAWEADAKAEEDARQKGEPPGEAW
jgi:hypothetical protein